MTTKKGTTRRLLPTHAEKASFPEAEIVQALIHDIHGAFEKLVVTYQAEFLAFAINELKDPDNAEECVQDTFLRAYRHLLRKSPESIATLRLRGWLYKILKNVIKDAQVASRKGAAVSLSPNHQTYQEWLEQCMADTTSEDAEQRWMRLETTNQLAALIQHLPPIQQQILGLRYAHALSYQNIGRWLDMPTATARNYAYRAIHTLQKMIEEQAAQEGRLTSSDLRYWQQATDVDMWLFGEEMLLDYYDDLKNSMIQTNAALLPEERAFMKEFGGDSRIPLQETRHIKKQK